jgi:hypothetical protein
MDNEVKGEGNSINYKFRMHSLSRFYGNPRVGRFFAVDPLTAKYPWYTPYSFSGNKVINSSELEGAEEIIQIFNGFEWLYFDRSMKLDWHSLQMSIRAYAMKANNEGNFYFYGRKEYEEEAKKDKQYAPIHGTLWVNFINENYPNVTYNPGNEHVPMNTDGVILEAILTYNPFGPLTHYLFSDRELDYRDQQFHNVQKNTWMAIGAGLTLGSGVYAAAGEEGTAWAFSRLSYYHAVSTFSTTLSADVYKGNLVEIGKDLASYGTGRFLGSYFKSNDYFNRAFSSLMLKGHIVMYKLLYAKTNAKKAFKEIFKELGKNMEQKKLNLGNH